MFFGSLSRVHDGVDFVASYPLAGYFDEKLFESSCDAPRVSDNWTGGIHIKPGSRQLCLLQGHCRLSAPALSLLPQTAPWVLTLPAVRQRVDT